MVSSERRRGERELAEIAVDLAFVLFVKLLPNLVAVGGMEDDVGRPAGRAGERLQAHFHVLGVVAAPVKPGGAADPFVLAAAVQLRLVRPQLEHGDLVGLHVGQQPFVGVEAVVAVRENRDRLIDAVGVLHDLADA